VSDIVSELEARIEPLRLQSEDARKYLQLRDEQKDLDMNVFLIRSERYTERIDELKKTVSELTEALSESEKEQEDLNSRREMRQTELSEKELSVYKRGRNAHVNSIPKNASVGEYHSATGLETLFGYLHLSAQDERAEALFKIIWETCEKGE
jgi:ribonuclease-3 family protein